MPSDETRPLLTETTFRVRFAETDMMGVVHHANYLVYFEEGRSALSRHVGSPYAALEASGFSLAVSEVHIRYMGSARYDEEITVRSWIGQVQSRAVTFEHEVVRAASGEVLARGTVRTICVDRQGRVCRLPERWIAPFKAALALWQATAGVQ